MSLSIPESAFNFDVFTREEFLQKIAQKPRYSGVVDLPEEEQRRLWVSFLHARYREHMVAKNKDLTQRYRDLLYEEGETFGQLLSGTVELLADPEAREELKPLGRAAMGLLETFFPEKTRRFRTALENWHEYEEKTAPQQPEPQSEFVKARRPSRVERMKRQLLEEDNASAELQRAADKRAAEIRKMNLPQKEEERRIKNLYDRLEQMLREL